MLFTFVLVMLLLPLCLLVYPFFILMLLYFGLFIDHVIKSIVFVFVAFAYHFNVKRSEYLMAEIFRRFEN